MYDDEEELTFDEPEMGDEQLFEYSPLRAEEPALVILVDGADRLCSTSNKRLNAEAVDALRRLLLAGSAHGIHMVLTAERPEDIESINTTWGGRVVGRVPTAEAARLATGARGSGAQNLLGSGDFLITLNAELIGFQAGAVSYAEVEKAVELIRSCATSYPQPNVPEPRRPAQQTGRDHVAQQEPRPIRSWVGE
jgi:DNA segregation ATPase FtsK/SpoIIIE-like protein